MNISISRIDRLGAGVSSLCAIHCALMPFLAAILPLAGFRFLDDARFEWVMIALSITLASLGVRRGIHLHHDNRVWILFGAGAISLLASRVLAHGVFQLAFAVAGGLLFVFSHWINHRLGRSCGCHH
jgi:hypothetical protein